MPKSKIKTLNNWISKQVVQSLINSDYQSALYLLYNYHEELEKEVFIKTFKFIVTWFNDKLDALQCYARNNCSIAVFSFVCSSIKVIYNEKD